MQGILDFRVMPMVGFISKFKRRTGEEVSAYSASDGTLRFLGMLAALLDEDYVGALLLRGDRQRHSIRRGCTCCLTSSNGKPQRGRFR